jgi:hypothetical protein
VDRRRELEDCAQPEPGDSTNFLHAVSAVSANDIWAVGSFGNASGPGGGLVAHWDGTNWTQVPGLPPSTGILGAAAVSATNVWVAGVKGDDPVLLHYNGTNWTQAAFPELTPVPEPGEAADFQLTSMTATSASDIWAVGSYISDGVTQTLTVRWNGTGWSQVPSPAGPGLTAVSSSSPANAWAGGSDTLLHWDGQVWNPVPSPISGSAAHIEGLSAVSPTSAFAVGGTGPSPSPSQTLMLQWDGNSWAQVNSPSPGSTSNLFNGVAAGQGGIVWAVATKGISTFSVRTQIVEFGVVPDVTGDSEAAAGDAIMSRAWGRRPGIWCLRFAVRAIRAR